MEKEWASWDEAAKVGHDVLSVHRGLRAEGPEISGFLLSIPEGSVSDKKRLVRLYKHYERSEIADAVAGKIRSVFAASEEGKAVASLLESEAMDEDGAKKVLEAFVSDCEK